MGLVGCAVRIVIISADREIYKLLWGRGNRLQVSTKKRAPIPGIGARLYGFFDHFICR
jgi:hypothetical protein